MKTTQASALLRMLRARASGGPRRYAFHVYRWGQETPDPADMHAVHLEVLEQALAFVSGDTVLIQREQGPWAIDRSMPT